MSANLGPPPPDPFTDPIATALVDVIYERGYEAADVDAVVERAGVDRADFDSRFAGKEDCVQQCFEAFAADFSWRVREAFDSRPDWPANLRAAAYTVARWLDEHPRTARFGNVDVLAADSEIVRVRREHLFQAHAALIDAGREAAPDPEAIPESAALIAIGAIAQMLTQRLQGGQSLETERMVPELMYLAVRPYLGEERARLELTTAPPVLAEPRRCGQ